MEKIDSKHIISNMIWRFLESSGSEVIQFVISIILARLLDPSVYGTVAIVIVFTSILRIFIDSGFGTALVQKKNSDDLDFSSVFYFNILICILTYILLYALAPKVAHFYKKIELVSVIRVLGLSLLVYGVRNIQQSYVAKYLLFKRFFWATLGGTLLSSFIGISLAYRGYGVWALVWQQFTVSFISMVILWITVKWRPIPKFSFCRLKVLFNFSWKLLASSILDTVYRDMRTLIIGKLYSSRDLAFYQKGSQLPSLLIDNINASINSVLLPTMSNEQDNRERIKYMTRRSIMSSTFIIMPMMAGFAACSTIFVRLVLTEKWMPCVFFLRIFCITYSFHPIQTSNLSAIKAMGRSDLFLKLEIIKKTLGLLSLLLTVWIGVKAIALSALVFSFVSQIVNSWPNKKLLDYSYFDQIRDILPQIILSIIMGILIYSITYLNLNDFLSLCIQIPLGCVVYITLARTLKFQSEIYVENLIRNFFKRN